MVVNNTLKKTIAANVSLGAAAAGVLALTPLVIPQAAAAQVQAQQTYSCAITVDENPTAPSYMDVTVNIALNLPDQVAPGEQFSADGNLSFQLPGEMGAMFGAYFPTAQVTSDALTFPVNVAGTEQLVQTSYIDSGTIDTRNPPVVFGGGFTTDMITVPSGAQGEVSFSMPRNGSVPAISRDGMAAFTATLLAQGGLIPGYDKGTDRVSCDVASDAPAQIGSVPVRSGGSAGSTGANSGAQGGTGISNSGGNRVQAAQNGGGAPTNGNLAANNGQPGTAQASDDSTRVLADQMRLLSMNQAASRSDGTSISVSTIGWSTLGIVLASVLFTVVTNARSRRLESASRDY